MVDTPVTTISMTAVRVSNLSAQEASIDPEEIQVNSSTVTGLPPSATSKNAMIESPSAPNMPAQVTSCAGRSPMARFPKPAMRLPSSGRKTIAAYIRPYPFIRLISSTAMLPRLRKYTTRMARPMAASAAATVSTKSAKI